MVIIMRNTKYEKIAKRHPVTETRLENALISFLAGGFIGFLAEALIEIFMHFFSMARVDASVLMIVIFIFFASFFTALGFFDRMVQVFKCGLLIPITGFAHSLTSSAIDYRGEGLIYGIGSNLFKLAGSVIVYGIVSSSLLGMIRFLLGGIS